MIKGYRFHANEGKLWLVLLEYGENEISYEEILEAVKSTKVEYFNKDAVNEAYTAGISNVIEVASPPPSELEAACWVTINPKDDNAIINLFPPIGEGKMAGESDIRRELDKAGCADYFYLDDAIQRYVAQYRRDRQPTVFDAAEKRDATIQVETASDRRSAYINYNHAWGGKILTLDEALEEIKDHDVRFGVNQERVKEILEADRDCSKQRIAGAQEPVSGEDASIDYLFDAYHHKAGPVISEQTDCADFRDLNLFETVEIDAELARRIPLTTGKDGMDVMGGPIKAEAGKEIQIPKGKNTLISPNDENLLVAQCAGTPKLVHGKVIVDEVLFVNDVDFSTGNINFNGDVVIKGIVNAGFSITANGNIICNDTVEGADLNAKENIQLKRGIKGMNKSTITAGGNVIARFIENCKVNANNSVVVDEALIHSRVFANNTVEVNHPKGSIFGGIIKARTLIRAAFIGSEMAVKTDLEVGVAPQLKKQLDELNTQLPTKKKDLDRASKNLIALNTMREETGLTPEREDLREKLGTAATQLVSEIEKIAANIAHLEKDLRECADGRVEATKTIYPGVVITIKISKRRITEPINKALFLKEGPDVVLSTELPDLDEESK